MNRTPSTLGLPANIILILSVIALSPAQARAQDGDLDRELLTRYAQAHLQAHLDLNDARDEFHGKVGRVHDEEGRRRAREELEARVEEIFEQHEMTPAEYDDITLTISLDGAVRSVFEEILLALEEGEPGGSAGDAVVVVDRSEALE
jgi:hypothetical protein